MTTAIKLDQVSIVFGDSPEAALPYMDLQWDRAAIQEKTNQLMAVRDCSLEVEEGRNLRVDGALRFWQVNASSGCQRP